MEEITVKIPSRLAHNAQIVTGFAMLHRQGWPVTLEDGGRNTCDAVVLAAYRGRRIVYDLWDGYQYPDRMGLHLQQADFYFKRSFDTERNKVLFPDAWDRMHPLGFNYHVTFPGTPFAEPAWKAAAKTLLGRTPDRYFSPARFEGRATAPDGDPGILFMTRLWDPEEPGLGPELQAERAQINATRIAILRTLRHQYGNHFRGGLADMPLSRAMAPDLILPRKWTQRKSYLKLVRHSDICIGSMGLHGSIGWKTGEYVAAAKAIVNEALCYQVPGNFREGTHYLSFSTADECLAAVAQLVSNPGEILAMKQANARYYREYLRPDMMVRHTLEIAETDSLQ